MSNQPPVILFASRDLARLRPLRVDLRRRGARVLTASTAQEIAGLSVVHHPDLLLLEPQIPDPPERTLVSWIREASPETRIIFLGVSDPDQERELTLRHDLHEFLPALSSPELLLQQILPLFPQRLLPVPSTPKVLPKVLCVDDDALYLRSLERILIQHGYRVETFDDPERALEALPECRPDVAIVDILMPGMSGLDLAEEIHEESGGRIPVVVLSGLTSDADIVKGYRRGATYYITKPCEPDSVLNIVDYLVGDLDREERELLETQL